MWIVLALPVAYEVHNFTAIILFALRGCTHASVIQNISLRLLSNLRIKTPCLTYKQLLDPELSIC